MLEKKELKKEIENSRKIAKGIRRHFLILSIMFALFTVYWAIVKIWIIVVINVVAIIYYLYIGYCKTSSVLRYCDKLELYDSYNLKTTDETLKGVK